MGAAVAGFVPVDAGLDVVAIGRDLHHRTWSMLIEPTEHGNELFFESITPEGESVRFMRVHPKLRALARFHPFGPDISEQAIGKEAKLVRLCLGEIECDTFRPEPGLPSASAFSISCMV